MKKRILAFALTLAMVITSLSMLSFVSFADDAAAGADTDVVAEDFYAYRATATIDGLLGLDELYVPVQRKVAPNVAMGVAWDYDNVYVILYQEPATNGVAGARKDYLENGTLTIGGVEVALDWAAKTSVFPEGSNGKAVLGGTYDVEIAVPLSEITLDAEALAAGKIVVPMAMSLNTMVGETSTLTAKNFNLIFTGRTMIAEMNNINPTYGHSGVANMFGSGHAYDRATGSYVNDAGITQKGGNAGAGYWTVKDASTYVGKVEVLRFMHDMVNYVNINDGANNYYEFEFNIANLPVGTITTNDTITTFNNAASNIQIATAGSHISAPRGFLGWLYNDADKGLCLAYYNGTGTPTILDLGVDMGKDFVLGIRESNGGNNSGTIEIYINDVLASTYKGGLPGYQLSGDTGAVMVGYHRGNQNSYSLDIDANGTVDADEVVEFTMSGFVLAKDNAVDVATVASLTKGGEAVATPIITAYAYPNATPPKLNVGSMTDAYATFDLEAKNVKIYLGTANINSAKVKLGGITVNITGFTTNEIKSTPNSSTAVIDDESIAKGIKVSMASRTKQYTVLEFPLELVYAYEGADGKAYMDLEIEVIKEDQVIQNPGTENEKVRRKNATKGYAAGHVVFDDAKKVNHYFNATVSNFSTILSENDTVTGFTTATGAGITAGLISEDKTSIVYTGQDTRLNTYWNNGAKQQVYANRTISFTVNVTDMNAYNFNGNYSSAAQPHVKNDAGVWSDIGTVRPYQRLMYFMSSYANANGSRINTLAFQIVRDTTDGLVLLHTAWDGTVTPVVIGDDNMGKDVAIKVLWNADESGAIYINDVLKATITDTKMSTVNTLSGKPNFLATGGNSWNGFVYMNGSINYTIEEGAYTVDSILDIAAKYDPSIPFAQLAYVQESAVKANNTFSIRLLAIINTLEASEAGFAVSVKGSDVEATNYVTTTVYDSVWQTVDGERSLLVAPNGTNFLAVTIPFVEAARIVEDEVVGGEDDVAPVDEAAEPVTEPVTVTYIVKPFFVSGGETTYGVAYEITYTNGVFMGAVIAR